MSRKKGLSKDGVISHFKCFWEADKTKEVTAGFGNMKIIEDLDRNHFSEVVGTEALAQRVEARMQDKEGEIDKSNPCLYAGGYSGLSS